MLDNTIQHTRIADLEREIRAEKARLELEREIEEARPVRDPLKIATAELEADIPFQVKRENLRNDLAQFTTDLGRLRFETLRAIERLEQRRSVLGASGQALLDDLATFFKRRSVDLAFGQANFYAREGSQAINLESPTVHVTSESRTDLETRTRPTLEAAGLEPLEIAALFAPR